MLAHYLGTSTVFAVEMSFLMAHTFSKRFQHSRTNIADNSRADLSFLRLDLSVPGGYVRFLYVAMIAVTQETW